MEPELGDNLVALNMIRDLEVVDGRASLTLMLTTPACPYIDELVEQIRGAVLTVEGVSSVDVMVASNIPANPQLYGKNGLLIKNLIAISSGKGGVGKSTVAVNIAVTLAASGASVGLLDADITGPNLPLLMGLEGKRPITGMNKLQPLESYGVRVISMGFLMDPDRAVIWRGPMIHGAVRQLFTDVNWGELDYLIVDLPPGTGDAQLTMAQTVPVSGAIIVTQPMQLAVGDALRGVAMFREVNVPLLGIVENMSGEFFGEGGGAKLAEQQNIPFLGAVPLDSKVRVGGDAGQPIVIADPDSPAAVALRAIAGMVAIRLSKMALDQEGDDIPITVIE
nr:Mrp/NBP35 family ATP-binding protein [Anaerolineae bacterium]